MSQAQQQVIDEEFTLTTQPDGALLLQNNKPEHAPFLFMFIGWYAMVLLFLLMATFGSLTGKYFNLASAWDFILVAACLGLLGLPLLLSSLYRYEEWLITQNKIQYRYVWRKRRFGKDVCQSFYNCSLCVRYVPASDSFRDKQQWEISIGKVHAMGFDLRSTLYTIHSQRGDWDTMHALASRAAQVTGWELLVEPRKD